LLCEKLESRTASSAELESEALSSTTRLVLASSIDRCQKLSKELARRWNLWQEFVVRRDKANTPVKRHGFHRTLRWTKDFSRNQKQEETLTYWREENSYRRNRPRSPTVFKRCLKQWDPLEIAYTEVRSLNVDFVHANKQYAETLVTIREELDYESKLEAPARDVDAELRAVEQRVEYSSSETDQVKQRFAAAKAILDVLSKGDLEALSHAKSCLTSGRRCSPCASSV